jgi:RNAse (barnase) inhibitor barstar
MITITIDGGVIDSLENFYDQLEPILLAGDCPWGRNLDSLQEIVECQFNYTDNRDLDVTKIIWTNSAISKQQLGKQETIEWIESKLSGVKSAEHIRWFEQQLKLVRSGERSTLYDRIVEIFKSSKGIEFVTN